MAFYRPYYNAHSHDKTRPYAGILPAMRRLREMGLRLAVISNKPDASVQRIAAMDFPGLLDFVSGEREGVRRKPWPDLPRLAADSLGVPLARCLYVGDSEVDVETAGNAGMDCVAVSWGFRTREELAGARVIIDRPEELVALVG